jgi:hypothetical protein
VPILPLEEQIENSLLYYEEHVDTWFLFTNHLGQAYDERGNLAEYTAAIWVYWSRALGRWDPAHQGVVLDRLNRGWSSHIVGLPSVIRIGGRLAIYYDALAGEGIAISSHLRRDIGLAWLDLSLSIPVPASMPSAHHEARGPGAGMKQMRHPGRERN